MTDQGLLPEIAHGSHFLPLNFALYSLLPNDVNIIFYLTYVSSLSCILMHVPAFEATRNCLRLSGR